MNHNVGRIVSIDDEQFTSYAVHQGIDNSRQSQYDNSPYYYGSNGTYASNIRSERCITMKVFVYDDDYEKADIFRSMMFLIISETIMVCKDFHQRCLIQLNQN